MSISSEASIIINVATYQALESQTLFILMGMKMVRAASSFELSNMSRENPQRGTE